MAREKSVLSQLGRAKWELWLENSLLNLLQGMGMSLASPDRNGAMSKEAYVTVSQILTDDTGSIITDENNNKNFSIKWQN